MAYLVLLCHRHHCLVHEEGFGVQAEQSGAINFTLPDGILIPPGPDQRSRGNFVAQKVKDREMGLDFTSETPVPNWWGEKMDNELTVLGLLQLE